MKIIYIQDCPFTFHSVYDLYAASEDGRMVHIIKQIPHIGDKDKTGFIYFNVRKHGQPGFKKVYAHNFVWECHNGIIPDDKQIIHLNGDCEDNRLINLKLVEQDKSKLIKKDKAKLVKNDKLKLDEKDISKYMIHQTYDLYAAAEDGTVINIEKKKQLIGNKNHTGYMLCSVKKSGEQGWKSCHVHRFVWECFNGKIPDGKVIDHCNDDKEDNRLCNLQLMTQQQNCKKSAKKRDYKFAAQNHKNRKCVEATNKDTGEKSYFNSMSVVQQHLGINAGIVKMAAEGLNKCKSGKSKVDGHYYTFEYIKKEDLPLNFKKSANIRPIKYLNDEKRKKIREYCRIHNNMEYKCPKCDKVMKNRYKSKHNKDCN